MTTVGSAASEWVHVPIDRLAALVIVAVIVKVGWDVLAASLGGISPSGPLRDSRRDP
jgi:hypothetical protein